MKKVKYDINGLSCANCALKVEKHLNEDDNIEKASVNFANKSMKISYKNNEYSEDKIMEIIKEVEDDDIKINAQKDDENVKKVKIIDKETSNLIIRVLIGFMLLIMGLLIEHLLVSEQLSFWWWVMLSIYIIAYLLLAYDYLWKVAKNIRKWNNIFDETTLMVIASLGAFIIGSYEEAVLVVLLARIGNIFEEVSLNRSHNLIIDAIDMRPKTASLVLNLKETKVVPAGELKVGDEIIIKVGEVIPVDGEVVDGEGTLDTSSVTGEFIPLEVVKGAKVFSGSLLKSGSLKLKATSEFANSTTSKIIDMVVDSSEHKAKAENFISKFAKVYTPIVVIAALVIATIPPLFISLASQNWSSSIWIDYLYVALTFLVIACPCAIVISVPLSFFTGIGLASKNGIIVKGANYLDRLSEVKTLVTDKTGTLTTGEFSISEIKPIDIDLDKFKEYIYAAESYSTHPIAIAIRKNLSNIKLNGTISSYEEKIGNGVKLKYDSHEIMFGNAKMMSEFGINEIDIFDGLTVLYLAVDSSYKGYVILDDTIKINAHKTIAALAKRGVNTLMLTGGNEKSADKVANTLGIKEYHAELLPNQKIDYLKAELSSKGAVAFMGDGVNDAPSIILSDVGVAMGGLGSDSAIENADVVLMNDDPYKFVEAVKIAKSTRFRAITCISIALFIKISIMIITLLLTAFKIDFDMMWIAVLADTGLTVLLVIYAVSLIKKKIK
ncbi:MAG: heavy metal translocating P-type ATPase [Erysipelotrichaceae bacterium]|jgi:Cd2+/Zn2+-exporting ATPase|nr:heavy metal translocating P-type ATPase [Erysipelotrichaceae bacterium]